jgi:lia operon protein LiaI
MIPDKMKSRMMKGGKRMKQFILFALALVALIVLFANLGPIILFAVGIWLLYVVFKQFMKADSLGKKLGWLILGIIIVSVTIFNVFAMIGLLAAYGLYLIYKEFKKEKHHQEWDSFYKDDPFTNFEKEWAELNKY